MFNPFVVTNMDVEILMHIQIFIPVKACFFFNGNSTIQCHYKSMSKRNYLFRIDILGKTCILTKNLVSLASSFWTRYLIWKNLYANVPIIWDSFLLFACIHILIGAFHVVEIFHLMEIFAINEWKLERSILNRLKYKKIKLCYNSSVETFFHCSICSIPNIVEL